eukprot:scaffold11187_cov30-Tisochrysis_lutea.AAC.6
MRSPSGRSIGNSSSEMPPFANADKSCGAPTAFKPVRDEGDGNVICAVWTALRRVKGSVGNDVVARFPSPVAPDAAAKRRAQSASGGDSTKRSEKSATPLASVSIVPV